MRSMEGPWALAPEGVFEFGLGVGWQVGEVGDGVSVSYDVREGQVSSFK